MAFLRVFDGILEGEFASFLRALRERACLTQEELAERSGLSIRAISDLERGRTSKPHRKSVVLLAEALRIEGDSLERFRRMARRATRSAALGAVRPVSVPAPVAVPAPSGPGGGQVPPGAPALIEWMREVLVEEPARQHGLGDAGAAGPRLVELVGGPGTGKTAVAVQAVAQFRRHFPDGQFYVDAAAGGCGQEELVGRLLRVFGTDPAVCGTTEEQARRLRSLLRSRRALLVLDNVEDAAQVRPLLARDGACAVIVIARRRLAVFDGVWTIDVPPAGPHDGARAPAVRAGAADRLTHRQY